MTDVIENFPLCWPSGWPRAKSFRSHAPYKISGDLARRELLHELKLMGAVDVVVSSNVPLRRDGAPYADASGRACSDPGVAVYFRRKAGGERQVIACDKWPRPDSNIRAIGLCVEAMRAIARSGASELLDRAFTGFKALPASPEAEWWMVLDVARGANADQIKSAYRELALKHHPDRGGAAPEWARVSAAYQHAKQLGLVT